MFRNRRSSQKPNEEFYAAFKQTFPALAPGVTSAGEAPLLRSTSLSDALTDAQIPQRQFGEIDDLKEQDATPKLLSDNWRFTPSLMDPNSFAFATFANQPPGYYTPTPGGVNTLFHSQAGDLHTPGMGMNIGTPTSLPHTAHLHHHDSAMTDLHHFQPHFLQTHHFQNLHPFGQHQNLHPQQQAFHPSNFLQHQDSGYGAMDRSPNKSPANAELMRQQQQQTQMVPVIHKNSMAPLPFPAGEKFRYHATLNAPTAMIKHADEIPITYLNKGQAYTLSVVDTASLAPATGLVKYRTFVRISFEDEQQRSKPAACWQLWKEGRGTNEAHQRGGKLLAVEYVDPNQGGDDETRKPQIELESASFDGFCVTWTQNPVTGGADCAISVRFNFLSTDFSHSKGVKGIPVRLCAKTEMLSSPAEASLTGESEVCFCKVKLFRDHGAERKLSNDVAHVKKTIEKLKQQIAQAESGMGSFGKRKRSGSSNKGLLSKPGKVVKHKRTWSVDSDGEGNGRPSAEEDLHIKLATMQDMFTSTRPVSILFLKGDAEDDPDKFPVQIGGDASDLMDLSRTQTWESKPSPESTSATSNLMSPTPSSTSLPSINRPADRKQSLIPAAPGAVAATHQESTDWTQSQSPANSMKILKMPSTGESTGYINAVGVDTTYVPPEERPIKPVACFYIAEHPANPAEPNVLYKAVYLMQRSAKDLINGVASKCSVDPSRVTYAVRISSKGIRIAIDEDVVRELPEGQDMFVEFLDADQDSTKNEMLNTAADLLVDGDVPMISNATTDGLEMRLIF